MKETDVFTSQDLFEQENLNQVVSTLYALNSIAMQFKNQGKYSGPLIKGGYAQAKESKRNFTEEQLRKGQNVVPFASRGAIARDTGGKLDSAGVVKTAGTENWKISNEQSAWSK